MTDTRATVSDALLEFWSENDLPKKNYFREIEASFCACGNRNGVCIRTFGSLADKCTVAYWAMSWSDMVCASREVSRPILLAMIMMSDCML